MEDLDATAASYFFAKIANGKVPDAVVGGEHDGLQYFQITIDGDDFWLTEYGLMNPECLSGVLPDDPPA